MPTILLVEDDATLRRATQLSLERDGFQVTIAADGRSGLEAYHRELPDLVLLDVMLPELDGVAVCRELRRAGETPVVMLSARGDAVDVVLGLEAGADDYVTKPFEPPVLSARLRAVLRRAERSEHSSTIRIREVEIDPAAVIVRRAGAVVPMTPTEYRLLLDLARNAGIARSRDALLADVWGYHWRGDTRMVDVHIARLRAKLGAELFETVRGVGYRMVR
jgi:DNA-binding response OmpR family regulator